MDADAESSSQRSEPAAPAPPDGEHLDGSRGRRSRNRGLMATLVVSFLLLLVAAAVQQVAVYGGGNGGGNGTYRAHGVSFHYPVDWDEISIETVAGAADELWETAVSPVAGPNVIDLVSVKAYQVDRPVTAQSLDADLPEHVAAVQQHAEQLGGAVQGGPEQLTMAGLPGLRFQITATVAGTAIQSTLSFAFDGTTEYFVNCQYTPARAEEIRRGCDQIIRTFSVD